MTKPQLHHAASSYVFRLLGRGRARARRTAGLALDGTLETLRGGGRSALIEVELSSGSLGRLLVQVGRLVFVQHEDRSGEKALAEIRQGAADAHLYTLELSDEQIIFACAALAGIPLALGETVDADPEQLPALLEQLSQGNFTGVMALEQGFQTLIWRFQRGRVLNTVSLPKRIRAGRLTQLVWQEQMLSEVGGNEPADAPPTVKAAPEQPAQPAAARSIQTTSVRHTMTRNTQVQDASRTPYLQSTPQNTQIPSTYVPNTAVHETPVRSSSAQSSSAQSAPAQDTPVQKTPVQNTSSRNASAQKYPAQNAPVQTTTVQNTPASRAQFGSSRKSRRQKVPEGTEEVWAAFQSVISEKLGTRADRVFGLMYTELGGFPKAELIGRLTGQVERIAGSAAARKFKNSFSDSL